MKKILFFLVFILVCGAIFSQHNFSEDFAKFEKEFAPLLSNPGDYRPKSHNMSKEFITFWSTDSLTNQEKTNFIKSIKDITAKSCKAYPTYIAFTDNLMIFCRKNVDRGQYQNYEKYLNDLLKSKKTKTAEITKLIVDVNNFVSKDILSESNKSYWKIQNNSFLFKYEDGLKLIINNANLVGYQGKDSLKIYNTNGEYDFKEDKWKGKGGKIYWEKFNYPTDKIYALINDYSIKMNNLFYSSDSVTFYNSFFYDKPIIGKLTDKASNTEHPDKSQYPKFVSYQQHYKIANVVEGIDYEGGFSIQGRKFNLSGTKEKLAKMTIKKNELFSLEAYSTSFYLTPDNLSSNNTEVKLLLENDSIYHPDVLFKYNIPKKNLELYRTKETDLSKVAFKNSYHKIKMDITNIYWDVDKFKIEFNNAEKTQQISEAFFESSDYYRLEKYTSIQKIDMVHPLKTISDFVFGHWGNSDFKLEDLSRYMNYNPVQVLQVVLFLTHQGYLHYDASTHNIRVYPETWLFLEAHKGTKDSDVIQIFSSTDVHKEPNAELSLLNLDLKIKGVSKVHVSDSQNVSIYPIDKNIILKKNRSFSFNGTVQAGQFYLYGSSFDFNYDDFIIDFPICDSMKITAESDVRDSKGNLKPVIVRNTFENLNGTFYIDAPGNKSGKAMFEEFPKLVSKDKSYVYFDDKNIQGGNYTRDNFYFEVAPFTKDSIKGYSRENLNFAGTLYSGKILPPIDETLVVRNLPVSLNDKEFYILCLGFKHFNKDKKIPIYDNKAIFCKEIDLSNYGLLAKGEVEYKGAKFEMDSILFLPNLMTGLSKSFDINPNIGGFNVPQSHGCNNLFAWDLEKDEFTIYSSKKTKVEEHIKHLASNTYLPNLKKEDLFSYYNPMSGCVQDKDKRFNMYDNIASLKYLSNNNQISREDKIDVYLDGDLIMKNAGLYGNGLLYIETDSSSALLKADDYIFEKSYVKSEDSFFKIFSERNFLNAEVLNSNYVNTTIDFKEQKGYFKKENIDDNYHFPRNLYECRANSAIWNMGKKDLTIRNDSKGLNDNKIEFTSSHPDQDSLSFEGVYADYNFNNMLIKAMQVDSINVADATIKIKENDTIVIDKNAVIHTIRDAQMFVNSVDRYHYIKDAVVDIQGGRKYTAEGDYEYYYNTKEEPQIIHFSDITPNMSGNSVGSAEVDIDKNFLIAQYFKFQGDLKFVGDVENLVYLGGTKIISDCDSTDNNEAWLKIKGEIDPQDIYIELASTTYDLNNNRLCSGLMINNTYSNIYTSFLNKPKNNNDQPLFTADGYLHYDQSEGKFIIGSKEKIENQNNPGNILKIHKNLCSLYGEGRFNLSNNFGLFNPNAIGEFLLFKDKDSIDINLSMLIDAHFSKDAYKSMADSIKKTSGLADIDLGNEYYLQAINEYLGTKKAEEWTNSISKRQFNKMPKELSNLFVLTDINLQWNKSLKSFIYVGPIGIANISKEQVNKYVWGILRIKKSKSGDSFELLLEPAADSWYYFRYGENALNAISSNNTFNEHIIKAKDKEISASKSENRPFRYGISSANRKNTLKRQISKYIKLEYDVFDDYDDYDETDDNDE